MALEHNTACQPANITLACIRIPSDGASTTCISRAMVATKAAIARIRDPSKLARVTRSNIT
jgi:hypothetical protein